MNLKYVLCSILILAALSGCTGGGDDKGAGDDVTTTTVAPATTAPPATDPPVVEAALHGEATCQSGCHDAPTLEDIRSGTHKAAFEKMEGHKDMCKNCHIPVETFCAQSECHALPDIMAPDDTAEGT